MLASWGSERHKRRQSSADSTNRSSFVTIKRITTSRSPSRARPESAAAGNYALHGVADPRTFNVPQRSRSSSARRSSGAPSFGLDEFSADGKRASHRLSHSTVSSQDGDKRRRKPAPIRHGLAASSLNVISRPDRSLPQAGKKYRPSDISIAAWRNPAPNPAANAGTAYPLESPLHSLDQPTDALGTERPRTPLLSDTQFTGDELPSAAGTQSVRPTFDIAKYQREAAEQRETDRRVEMQEAGARQQPEADQRRTTPQDPAPWSLESIGRRRSPEPRRRRRSKEQSQASVALSDLTKPALRAKRASKDEDKKTMLALALQRANDAVQLDNMEDFEGAITAYVEACDYLTQVMDRSSSSDDQGKLSAIRTTYTERIQEISQLELNQDLDHSPADLDETVEADSGHRNLVDGNDSIPLVELASATRILDNASDQQPRQTVNDLHHTDEDPLPSPASYSSMETMRKPFIPAPLALRRPSPQPPVTGFAGSLEAGQNDHVRPQGRALSPPDTTSESWHEGLEGRSRTSGSSSSHHSVSSLRQLRRKHLKTHSTSTEAEFDAALDAAVEAAYDDGYEPYLESQKVVQYEASEHTLHEDPPRDPYLAGRADRVVANKRRLLDRHGVAPIAAKPEPDLDSDEEDQLLQEGQDFMSDNLTRYSQPRATLPRQSDSSSSSGRTWGSSVASSVNTAGTPLSPVDENARKWTFQQPGSNTFPPPAPPPTTALPQPPRQAPVPSNSAKPAPTQTQSSLSAPTFTSVQDRRTSGQKGKRLKIETSAESKLHQFGPLHDSLDRPVPVPPKTAPGAIVSTEGRGDKQDQQMGGARNASRGHQLRSPYPTPFQATFSDHSALSPPTSSVTSAISNQSSINPSPGSASPKHPYQRPFHDRSLKNNTSNLSLRNKGLLTPAENSFEFSPQTPSSFTFSANSPVNVASPYGEVTPSPKAKPRPLEPCPEAQILRPYWLLRCFQQTIIHPDGGYLTNKLCIPRKAWQVANVKLKHVEDKVANCDLLTAALLKLGLIDTLDADAVLQEMESFEAIMTQVQTSLSKKLGHDVGPQSISSLFKEAPVTSPASERGTPTDQSGVTNSMGSNKSSSKGYFSLRKLRGKPSDAAIAKSYTSNQESQGKDGMSMSSVPMVSSLHLPSVRGARRDGAILSAGAEVRMQGPNANYMSALAKLCDAAQVLDQIARQVEDPGLRHSSPTHVGLELSSKHASEFFGLYICRFVLQDVMMLAEKHVKRASEYALN